MPDTGPSTLAEHDITFEGTSIHVWEGGQGFPLVMMHGSGAGASILGNYRKILEPLARQYRVIAADLVGFGQSGMSPRPPYFDLELWIRQAQFLIDFAGSSEVGFIGHSLSGAIGLKLAARERRVQALLLTGTMGTSFPSPSRSSRGWTYPEDPEQLEQFVASTVYDKASIPREELDHRMAILRQAGYREYFAEMFRHERQFYIDASEVTEEEISRIGCPVLMMHGREDGGFPPEVTALRLGEKLSQADVIVLGRCGHSVALEYPAKFLLGCELVFPSGAHRTAA